MLLTIHGFGQVVVYRGLVPRGLGPVGTFLGVVVTWSRRKARRISSLSGYRVTSRHLQVSAVVDKVEGYAATNTNKAISAGETHPYGHLPCVEAVFADAQGLTLVPVVGSLKHLECINLGSREIS